MVQGLRVGLGSVAYGNLTVEMRGARFKRLGVALRGRGLLYKGHAGLPAPLAASGRCIYFSFLGLRQ